MATLDDVIKKLPPETREIFQMVWETLSPDDRTVLQTLLGGLPPNAVLSRLLLRLSTQQLRMAFGQKQSIAILGPTNVGKSTLYNQFAQNKTDRAEVSPLPGTTRTNQEADAGVFSIVDTPGADAIGEVGEREQQVALDAAARADFLIILFDAIQGIKQTELDLFNQLVGLEKPYVVVLNKIDMVRRDKDLIVQHAAESLNLTVDQIIPIAAKTGEGLPQILAAVVALYEQEIGGTITAMIADELRELTETERNLERWRNVFRQSIGKGHRWAWVRKVIANPLPKTAPKPQARPVLGAGKRPPVAQAADAVVQARIQEIIQSRNGG